MKPWKTPHFKALLDLALAEDLNNGDITSMAMISDTQSCEAVIIAKSACIVCGQNVAKEVFQTVDTDVSYTILVEDGLKADSGSIISKLSGPATSILAGERIALNFLQHLSGVSTFTRQMVEEIQAFNCKIIDTRKTKPGYRILDKYAVLKGGGHNHRLNLGDGILIKENHINAAGGISKAVKQASLFARHNMKVQIEVKDMSEATEAVAAGADILLLDNMSPDDVTKIVKEFGSNVILECSGNLSFETVKDYAATGVNLLSVGAITHSAKAVDLSLLFK